MKPFVAYVFGVKASARAGYLLGVQSWAELANRCRPYLTRSTLRARAKTACTPSPSALKRDKPLCPSPKNLDFLPCNPAGRRLTSGPDEGSH
jgi:hypothetical protein